MAIEARAAAGLLALALGAGAAGAQPAAEIPQITPAAAGATALEEITPRSAAPTEAAQLSSRGLAGAPPDVAARRQGRSLAAAAIGGRDRCAAEAAAEPLPETCRHPIEARAEDYATPEAPPPTAEQALLQAVDGADADAAARRVAAGEVGSSQAAQAAGAAALGLPVGALAIPSPRRAGR